MAEMVKWGSVSTFNIRFACNRQGSLPDCLRQTLFEARNQPRFDAILSAAASEPTLGSKPSRASADKNVLAPARYLFRKRVSGGLLAACYGA